MFKKKRVIIAGTLLVFSIVAYFLLRGPSKEVVETQKPTTPLIQGNSHLNYSLESKIPQDISLPQSLPVYKVADTPWSEEKITSIGKVLGFSSTPEKIKGAMGTTSFVWWTENEGFLQISSIDKVVDFKAALDEPPTSASFPETNTLIAKASKELLDRNLINNEKEIVFSDSTYLKAESEDFEVVAKNAATVIKIKFNWTIDSYITVNNTPAQGSVSVFLSKDQELVSLYLDYPPSIIKERDYPLKNYSEIVASLDKATIRSLDGGKIDTSFIPSNLIKKVSVNSVAIGYFEENRPLQTLMQPIFIIKGVGELQTGAFVEAILYLPALKDQELQPLATPRSSN
jgi:hypothetical protein